MFFVYEPLNFIGVGYRKQYSNLVDVNILLFLYRYFISDETSM
jgi:hypothetical protein